MTKRFLLTLLCCYSLSALHAQYGNDCCVVINVEQPAPENARFIHSIRINDNIRTSCGYNETINEAKAIARPIKANIIKLTELWYPERGSSCYRIHADLYYTDQIDIIKQQQQHMSDSITRSLIPDTASYALLYVYRSLYQKGLDIPYILYLNDDSLSNINTGTYQIIKVKPQENATLWARPKKRGAIQFSIDTKKVYFIEVHTNFALAPPKIELIDNISFALNRYNSIANYKTEQKENRKKNAREIDDIYI